MTQDEVNESRKQTFGVIESAIILGAVDIAFGAFEAQCKLEYSEGHRDGALNTLDEMSKARAKTFSPDESN